MVLFCIIVMGFVGAIIGGVIKIFQWVAADLTFGILIKMPTLDSVLPMILKAAVIGMIFGLILGIYNLLPSNDCSYQEHHKEHDNRLHDYEYHAKKERYINASDVWCKSGDDYIDASGAWRKPGDK